MQEDGGPFLLTSLHLKMRINQCPGNEVDLCALNGIIFLTNIYYLKPVRKYFWNGFGIINSVQYFSPFCP